jgi:hypothetical protein
VTRAKISEYSATAGDNTDVNGVDIAEGCPPSSMNNMGREIMAALKRFQVGSDGDPVTIGGQLAVTGTTTTSPAIVAAGDTNTGIFFPAADTIAFAEGGAEAMRIDSSGNVGIGNSTPNLTPFGGTTQIVTIGSAARNIGVIELAGSQTTDANVGVISGYNIAGSARVSQINFIRTNADNSGSVSFLTNNAGSISEKARFTYDGYLRMASGTGGIQFNGDTAAGNALDDYEEGTWTPRIDGSTTAGTGTYSTQVGRYTKIGNLVTVICYLSWSAHTGTGTIYLSNLPFTSAGVTGFFQAITIGQCNNLALTANNYSLGYVIPAATYINVVQQPVGGGATTNVPIDTSADLMVTATYQAA